nr:hypothetical protein [Tanacetum cinerariifolium]
MSLVYSYKQLGHHQEEMLEQQDSSLVGETQLMIVVELSEVDMNFEEQKVECDLSPEWGKFVTDVKLMSTLAEFMIVVGAANRPTMLDKPMYESWKSHMELYLQGKDHGRIILNLVENDPLIWPTIEQENCIVRPKTYEELSDKEKLQTDCDLRDTNIVLQYLLPDVYSLVNHHKFAKDI